MKIKLASLVPVLVVGGVCACGSSATSSVRPVTLKPAPTLTSPAATPGSAPTGTSAPTVTSTPAPIPSVSSEPQAGSTLALSDDDHGNVDVTFVKVIDPATSDLGDLHEGTRMLGVMFDIVGQNASGDSTGDAFVNASVIGSNDQTYNPSLFPINECSGFNYGDYSLTFGQKAEGCVAFELPPGVTIKTVIFKSNFLSDDQGSWQA